MEIHDVLMESRKNASENCITIILNTHRTAPDSNKEGIVLKNLIREAEVLLKKKNEKNKSLTDLLVDKLKSLANEIDHRKNLDSLILFVNENIAEYARLAVPVENRVVVGTHFVIRDVVRAKYAEARYYVYIISMKEVHLWEAFNDRPVKIIGEPFPVINTEEDLSKLNDNTSSIRQSNLKANFLNKVDKLLNSIIKNNDLPVIVCSEESTFFEYLKIADNKDRFVGQFSYSLKNSKNMDIHITQAAWPILKKYNEEKNAERIVELEKAISRGQFYTDINDIMNAVKQGRGHILFVKTGYFLPVKQEGNIVVPLQEEEKNQPGIIDDMISELIEEMIRRGGEVVFLSGSILDRHRGVVLTTR